MKLQWNYIIFSSDVPNLQRGNFSEEVEHTDIEWEISGESEQAESEFTALNCFEKIFNKDLNRYQEFCDKCWIFFYSGATQKSIKSS